MGTGEAITKETELREKALRVTSSFLILDIDALIADLDELKSEEGAVRDYITAVFDGLESVLYAATVPFKLTVNAVHQMQFDRFFSAERIRRLKDTPPGEQLSAENVKKARETARARMDEFASSAPGSDILRDTVMRDLLRSLSSKSIDKAAHELLAQALVSTWSTFEYCTSQFIVSTINNHPHLAKLVLSSPELRSYFGKQVIDFDAFDEHGYDLSRSMGSIIFRGRRLDSLSVVRSLLSTMFESPHLRTALADELWMLNQRRHLIVHKRGVVDREYLDKTGDIFDVGQRISVSGQDVEGYLFAVRRAVICIAEASQNMR